MKERYVYGFSDDNFWSEQFDTAEKALAEAREKHPIAAKDFGKVYVGKVGGIWEPEIDGESMIEMMREMADEEAGDAAAHYLEDVPEEDVKKLTDALTEAFKRWAAENGYVPTFYTVENVKEYEL